MEQNSKNKNGMVLPESVGHPIKYILPILVISMILVVVTEYSINIRKTVVRNAEQVTNQIAEYVADNIANTIGYAESSIKLAAVTITQTMTSNELENPADVILPMISNTPFGSIEYIRADGMNVMNIGEPFDARDRVYYIEGIKGNTGIWNNFHPKTLKETLMNFYTPLVYNGEVAGVITGYIEANTQIAPLFETKLYGEPVYGILLDQDNMVICSTLQSEFVKDLTLDMFLDKFGLDEDKRRRTQNTLEAATYTAASYKDPSGEGRICVVKIPETGWIVGIIVPATSFKAIINEHTSHSIIAIGIITFILLSYATFIILNDVKRRREIAANNVILAEENRVFDEENKRAFAEISEIRDIIASANMGTWRIEIVEGKEPRMFVDDTMIELLGLSETENSPEEIYKNWYSNIKPEAIQSVQQSVERMEQGFFDENTYLWIHPTKGVRYVRCGGTAQEIPGGFLLRGYHYDVDEVVRKEQEQRHKLLEALIEKDAAKRAEEALLIKSYTDELTGLFNRRAYEENIYDHDEPPREDKFIYVSLDLNGLKVVNDTDGHTAGDELISGACQCMNKSLGPYGKIYRIGGDEFVAILYCSSSDMGEILKDFDMTIDNWRGQLVSNLSISYGWVSKEEMPEASVRKLGAVAEERMYVAKAAHYRKKGVDRRGQQDAHKALCELYTKILKINITDDTYQIVNIDAGEKSASMGFSDKISEWLYSFGKSGLVHTDDLDEYLKLTNINYLREYFAGNKTSLHVFYRRKYGDDFKQVMMEVIPANDYSDDNQSLFLYVKDIEK